jgi:hypothetical protein
VPIPCKQFTVLDLAERLVDESKPPESVMLQTTTTTYLGRTVENSAANSEDIAVQAASVASATVKSGRVPFVIGQGDQLAAIQPHTTAVVGSPPPPSPSTGHGQCNVI